LQSASYLAGLVESLSQDGMEAVVPVLPDLWMVELHGIMWIIMCSLRDYYGWYIYHMPDIFHLFNSILFGEGMVVWMV
jgi:hypothetical protein